MLFDTWAWIEFFNGSKQGLKASELLKANDCFTSAISLAEISKWCERNNLDSVKKISEVKAFSTIIPLDEQLLISAGKIAFERQKIQKDFGLIDAIILSTAKSYNFKIVTGDLHFKEVPGTIML